MLYSATNPAFSVSAMSSDAGGNIYLVGTTSSSTFPTTPGVVQPAIGGGFCLTLGFGQGGSGLFPCEDAVVMKLDRTGKIIYATYLGGTGLDHGTSIVADAAGNAYVAGIASTGFPTTAGAAYTTTTGSAAFVAKLNPSGTSLLYSTLIPGAWYSTPSITVAAAGSVFFAGSVRPSDTPLASTPGAFQSQPGDALGNKAVVVKLNATGSAFLYATYLSGTATPTLAYGQDYASGVAVDKDGNAYVTGFTASFDFPVTSGAFQTKLVSTSRFNGPGNAFVAKLNPAGSALLYATYLGGSAAEQATAIRVDAQGNARVIGGSYSTDFPVTAGALESAPPATWRVNNGNFLTTLNASATSLVYSTLLDGASSLDADAAGNTYVAGQAGRGFPVTSGADQRCLASGVDAFIAEFDASGKLLGATYFGDAGFQGSPLIVVAGNGAVYIAVLESNKLTVSQVTINDPAKPPAPCMAQVLNNGASFAYGPVAAGEIVTILGDALGPVAGVSVPADRAAPSQLAGVRVFFDQTPVPLLYVQSKQINAIVPWEFAGVASTKVHVEYNGASTGAASIAIAPAAPALFLADFVTTQGAIQNADGTFNSAANPAAKGSVVAMYGTGAGPMSPAGVTGGVWPFDPLSRISSTITAKILGIDAEVVYAGAAPGLVSGFFQINLRIPASAQSNATAPIQLTIGGTVFNLNATVAVR